MSRAAASLPTFTAPPFPAVNPFQERKSSPRSALVICYICCAEWDRSETLSVSAFRTVPILARVAI